MDANKKGLSKKKYIYRLYEAKDGVPHVEKYPVIYINERYVYFKVASKSELGRVDISDTYTSVVAYGKKDSRGWHADAKECFFWEDNIIGQRLISNIESERNEALKAILKIDITNARTRVIRRKAEYDQAVKELEQLEARLNGGS